MDEILQQRDKQLHVGFVTWKSRRHWLGVARNCVSTQSMLMTQLYLKKDTRTMGDLPYHLATDCGLQRIHQLCCDSDETVVVRLDLIVPFQVRY